MVLWGKYKVPTPKMWGTSPKGCRNNTKDVGRSVPPESPLMGKALHYKLYDCSKCFISGGESERQRTHYQLEVMKVCCMKQEGLTIQTMQ